MASVQTAPTLREWFNSLPEPIKHSFAYEVWRGSEDPDKYHQHNFGWQSIASNVNCITRTNRYKLMQFAKSPTIDGFNTLPEKIRHVFAKQVGSYPTIYSDIQTTRNTDIFHLCELLETQTAPQIQQLSDEVRRELYELVFKVSEDQDKWWQQNYGCEQVEQRPSIISEWKPQEVNEPDIITWLISRIALRQLVGNQAVDIRERTQHNLHDVYGSHPRDDGVDFVLYAPYARAVYVEVFLPDGSNLYRKMEETLGTWHLLVPEAHEGNYYTYHIVGVDGHSRRRGDPFALSGQTDQTSQVVGRRYLSAPVDLAPFSLNDKMTIYQVHIPTCGFGDGTFRSSAELIAKHVSALGFTHIQLLPHTQTSGKHACYNLRSLFAPNNEMGSLDDFCYFIDTMHSHGVKVLGDISIYHMDHDALVKDMQGTPHYEDCDPTTAGSPWGMSTFNFKDPSVKSFLASAINYWLHLVDGLRIDAAGCMFYPRSYSSDTSGMPENQAALSTMREILSFVRGYHPAKPVIAEEFCTGLEGWITNPDAFHLSWSALTHDMHNMAKHGFSARRIAEIGHMAHNKHAITAIQNHDRDRIMQYMPWDAGFSQMRQLLALCFLFPGTPQVWMGDEFATRQNWHEGEWLDRTNQSNPMHYPIIDLVKRLNDLQGAPCLKYSKNDCTQFSIVYCDEVNNIVAYRRGSPPFRSLVIHNFGNSFSHYHIPLDQHGINALRLWLNTEEKVYGGLSDDFGIEKIDTGVNLHNLPPNCTICIEEVF